MKVGILGTGFGAYHASIFKQQSAVTSVTLFGRNESRLDELKDKWSLQTTTHIEDIITDPDIQLIDVCLPSELHREYVVEALRHGKDVFCETPVSFTLEDAIAMREAAWQYNRRLFVNLFIKFSPEYAYIYKILQQNKYGKLQSLHITRKTPPLWGDLGLERIATALMIHDLDFITWLFGAPCAISTQGLTKNPYEAHVNASLQYADTLVELIGSSMMPRTYPFTVSYEAIFEEGAVEYLEYGSDQRQGKSMIEYTATSWKELPIPSVDPYVATIQHVIDCCQHNTPSCITIEDAILALDLSIQIKNALQKKS